jgi:hypothetical protein
LSSNGIGKVGRRLNPCTKVIDRESYARVLREIIESFKASNRGVSFYDLYNKKHVLNSKSTLKTILRVLEHCSYVVSVKTSAETNSPRGKKEYYPTPLGIFMHTIIKMYYFLKECYTVMQQEHQKIYERKKKEIKVILKAGEFHELHSLLELVNEFINKAFEPSYVYTKYFFTAPSNSSNTGTGSTNTTPTIDDGIAATYHAIYLLYKEFHHMRLAILDELLQDPHNRSVWLDWAKSELYRALGYYVAKTSEYKESMKKHNISCKECEEDFEYCENITCVEKKLLETFKDMCELSTKSFKVYDKVKPSLHLTSHLSSGSHNIRSTVN